MRRIPIDLDYVMQFLLRLLEVPSPTGYTDRVVRFVGEELERLGIEFELTRRGGIRATLKGRQESPDRALVAHVDTLGAMVRALKPNGRLAVVPIGSWSSRFAEGARVTVFTDRGALRGSLLPLKASGHAYDDEVNTQPVRWDQIELRLDEVIRTGADLAALGVAIGDYELTESGFIVARHLDDKAGVAVVVGAAKAAREAKLELPMDCHLLFTITEEVGSGGSAIMHADVAEMVTVDNAVCAPGQSSSELGVTIAMADMAGPFDWHLTHHLLALCARHDIPFARDIFPNYRSDSASAVEAGNDIRTALACFGLDASHGYERAHRDSLRALGELIVLYLQSPPAVPHDRDPLARLEGFPTQPG
jgi:peptidase M42 family hydrolase